MAENHIKKELNQKYPLHIVLLIAALSSPYADFGAWGGMVAMVLISIFVLKGSPSNRFPHKEMIFQCYVYVYCMIQSLIFFVLEKIEFQYFTRGISSGLNVIVIVYFAYKLICRYGREAFQYTFDGLMIAYLLTILVAISTYGLSPVFHSVFTLFTGGLANAEGAETDEILENCHAILLIMPMIAVLLLRSYLDTRKRWIFLRIIMSVIISLLAFKRVAIGAAIVMFIVTMFYKFYNKRMIWLSGIVTNVVLLGYIFIISTGLIYFLANEYDINLMFRDIVWPEFSPYYSFSWDFMGQGFGFTTKFLHLYNVKLTGVAIGGLHNDILKTYIDIGFIGTILYFSFFLIITPLRYRKTMSKETSFIFWALQLYLVIIYLTDNAMIYFPCQLVAYTAPFCLARSVEIKHKNMDVINI